MENRAFNGHHHGYDPVATGFERPDIPGLSEAMSALSMWGLLIAENAGAGNDILRSASPQSRQVGRAVLSTPPARAYYGRGVLRTARPTSLRHH